VAIILGPSAHTLFPAGSRFGGAFLTTPPYVIGITPITALILVQAEIDEQAFKMPLFYNLLPECTRQQDIELVNRGDVPAYSWDSIPRWDTSPFRWDEVIGPETILRTTMRIIQLDMEKTCIEIGEIARLYDLNRVDKSLLPYHASLLGTPLPGASELQQRAFLKELVDTYRNKGTPLSFFRLFEQLGFELQLEETYQRKSDGESLSGPQIFLRNSTLVVDEPLGTVVLGQTQYKLQTVNNPIVKGTIKLEIFDQSSTVPTVITDDGEGGWSDNISGSIHYRTGILNVTLPTSPALGGHPILITYDHRIDPFPDQDGIIYRDRHRSSLVKFAITPKNESIALTEELINRITLYLSLFKPAHILIRNLDVILNLSDTESAVDNLNPQSLLFVENLFGTHYIGSGWEADDNGSQEPDAVFPQPKHRTGREFLIDPSIDDPSNSAPYVYPFILNGIFVQPSSSNDFEADWFDNPATFSFTSTVTSDDPQAIGSFSISKGAGTTLGIGDGIIFEDGPAGGEQSYITGFTDNGTYYSVTVSPDYSVAPEIGDTVTIIDVNAINMRNLETDFRQQDPLDVYSGYDLSPTPDGIGIGPFTVIIPIAPLLGGSTSFLRFTISSTAYEETATGTGAFTNVNGFITASNIDYTTGDVTVTFNTAPDSSTELAVYSVNASSADVGVY